LVKDGRVKPYDEDLQAYRKMLLAVDKPAKEKKPNAPAPKPKVSRDEVLALKAEVRKSEDRVSKLNDMRDKLAKKLADPAMYEPEKVGEAAVWQKKYAEVMDALDRAEALWMQSLEKLEKLDS
jgi:ATP-binding cassette subfamily F protein 3